MLVNLLATVKASGMFHCCEGPSQLYDNWNDGDALDKALWLANLCGRHSIGVVETGGDVAGGR